MPGTPAFTVLTVDCDDARVRAALVPVLPNADVRSITAEFLSRLPDAAALIVASAQQARVARAGGFAGGIVVCAAAADDVEGATLLAQGTHFVDPAMPGRALADALIAAIPLSPTAAPQSLSPETVRMRRLLAAGELAVKLQHTLNNPLTALLAEVQMLQMDAPNDEIKASAVRMLALVRRLADISRSLDAVRDRRTGV
jgi:signal transduction histidine kinase